MLRYIRIFLAVIVFVAVIGVFVDFTGTAAGWFGFLPKYQVVPALLALNVVAIAVLAVLTLVFGRLYCSVLCPLGIFQDIVSRVRIAVTPRRKRKPGVFRFSKERKVLRYSFLAVFAVLFVAGLLALLPQSYAGLLDPYSIFGRGMGQFAVPAWRSAVSTAASTAADHGTYLIDAEPAVSPFVWVVAIVAAIQLVIVAVIAWRSGRGYCNAVCPVGTILGFLSRFSLLKPVINLEKCNSCGSCGRHCKASCINTKEHKIDYSRCVVCMDCVNNCTQGAITYTVRRKAAKPAQVTADAGRRSFMVGAALAAGAGVAMAADKTTDGGFAPVKNKKRHSGVRATVPAGAISLDHLRSHCTACQLCISACPSGVLKPSISPSNFMQPVMTFTEGFCRPECTSCADICPAGAIQPIGKEEKAVTKIGTAVVDTTQCISAAYGQACGNCARHCPAGAIHMVKGENGNMRPTVDESRCIGCGACEYHCPVGSAGMISSEQAAIYVEGVENHRII